MWVINASTLNPMQETQIIPTGNNMLVIFPTLIEQYQLEFDNTQFVNQALQIKQLCVPNNDWQCDTLTSINFYNLMHDPIFSDLHITSMLKVLQFAGNYGDITNKNVQCTSSWINISSPGSFQEYHVHPNNHFSAVYYAKFPKNSGNIVFRSYDHSGDMFPLPFDIKTEKEPAFRTYFLEPKESELIIFRSNLEHMVQKNASTEDRISIAMNFILQENIC